MRGVLDQDRDDDLLSLVIYPTHTLTDGLVPKLTHWPIQDLSKLYVFPSPVRKTNRGSTSLILEDLTREHWPAKFPGHQQIWVRPKGKYEPSGVLYTFLV